MKTAPAIIATGIGIFAIAASFHYFCPEHEPPGVEPPVHSEPSPAFKDRQSSQQIGTETATSSSSKELQEPWVAFREVVQDSVARLDPWLENEYLPTVRYLERLRVVEIDGDELARRLRRSWEAQQRNFPDKSANSFDSTDLIVNLFPDVTYRMAVHRLSVGSNGTVFATPHIVEGTTSNSNVQFEINTDFEVSIVVASEHGLFRVRPTSELPYYIITQANGKQAFRNIKIDAVIEE